MVEGGGKGRTRTRSVTIKRWIDRYDQARRTRRVITIICYVVINNTNNTNSNNNTNTNTNTRFWGFAPFFLNVLSFITHSFCTVIQLSDPVDPFPTATMMLILRI